MAEKGRLAEEGRLAEAVYSELAVISAKSNGPSVRGGDRLTADQSKMGNGHGNSVIAEVIRNRM